MKDYLKIEEFADVITGGTPSTINKEYWEGGSIPWLNSGELNQDIVTETSNYITELGMKNSSTRLMPPDTVLIALTGATTGKVGYLTIEACANQSVTGILPSKKHYPKFLYYFLGSIRNKVINDAYGGAQPHISQGYVKQIPIPLPPLATQKKIAAILDAADAYRKKTKTLIDKYDQLAQSLFLDMFGDPKNNSKNWKKKLIGELCVKIQIGPFGTQLHQSDYIDIGIPLVNPVNIRDNKIDLVGVVFISEEKYCTLPQYHLAKNDIIMARRGDLSKVGLIQSNDQRLFCGTGSLYIRFNDDVNMIFIHRLLSDASTTDYLLGESRGITMPNLNKNIISNIPVINPPISLQNQFAERIQLIESQKQQAHASLQKAEDLFNSLLQRAFKGELISD